MMIVKLIIEMPDEAHVIEVEDGTPEAELLRHIFHLGDQMIKSPAKRHNVLALADAVGNMKGIR